jgi:hypothetical protein
MTSWPTACAAATSTGPRAAITGCSAVPSAWIRTCSGGPSAATTGAIPRSAWASSGAAVVASWLITLNSARSPAWNAGFALTSASAPLIFVRVPMNPPPLAWVAANTFFTTVKTFFTTVPSCLSRPTAMSIAWLIAPDLNAPDSFWLIVVATPPTAAVNFLKVGAAAAAIWTMALTICAGIFVRDFRPSVAPLIAAPSVPFLPRLRAVDSTPVPMALSAWAAVCSPPYRAGRVAVAVVRSCRSRPANRVSWMARLIPANCGCMSCRTPTNARAFGESFSSALA